MKKKNKKLIVVSSVAVLAGGVITALALQGNLKQDFNFKAGGGTQYTYVLDKNNVPEVLGNGTIIPTALGNPISLDYTNCAKIADNHAQIATDGSISNSDAISGFTTVKAAFTGKLVLHYGQEVGRFSQVELTSGLTWANDIGYSFFKLEAKEAAVLSSVEFGYSCDKYVPVSNKAPIITLTGETTGSVREDFAFTLPTLKATTHDGIDITDNVVVKENDVIITDLASYRGLPGTHVLTYDVVDPFDNTLVAETKTVTIQIYQRILADGGSGAIVVENENAAATVKVNDQGIGLKGFYFPQASKQYYFEMMVAPMSFDTGIFAAAHYSGNDINQNTFPFQYNGLKMNASWWEFATSKKVDGWNDGNREWTAQEYLTNRGAASIALDPTKTAWKMGMARNGNNFYLFMNDKMVLCETNNSYQNIDTIPGLFSFANEGKHYDGALSAFIRKTGDDAVTKINSLTGPTTFAYFGMYGDSIAKDAVAFDQNNGFTYKDLICDNGIDEMNATMATPYYHAGGETWTVDYDYTVTKIGNNGNWGALMLDIRNLHDKPTALMIKQSANADGLYETITSSEIGSLSDDNNFQSEYAASGIATGINTKMHVSIVFTQDTAAHTESYAITWTDEAGKSFSKTNVMTYNGDKTYMVGSQKYFIFHSAKASGIVKNFTVK